MKFVRVINANEQEDFKLKVEELVNKYNITNLEPEIETYEGIGTSVRVDVNFNRSVKRPSFEGIPSEQEFRNSYEEYDSIQEQIKDILFDIESELRHIYRRKLYCNIDGIRASYGLRK